MKLHHLLQQEADELKRLLGAKGEVGGEQPAAAVEKSTRATLARLKTDLVSRRLHEANVSTSEVCWDRGHHSSGKQDSAGDDAKSKNCLFVFSVYRGVCLALTYKVHRRIHLADSGCNKFAETLPRV